MSKKRRTGGLVVWSAIALFFLWFLITQIFDVANAYQAVKWPVVQGTVISSGEVRGCAKAGSSYYPDVRYRYVIGDLTYTGQRIAFGNVGCGSSEHAQAIAGQYAVNTVIPVHYNSVQPADAVLLVGDVLNDTWLGVILMSVMFIVSIWFALIFYRSKVSQFDLNFRHKF